MDRELEKRTLVTRPTATRTGTVLVPFEDSCGRHTTVELTESQWHALALGIHEQFERIKYEAEVGAAVLSIDRHEGVV